MLLAYSVENKDRLLILRCSDGRELVTEQWDDAVGFFLMPTLNDMAVVWNVDAFVDDLVSIMPAKLAKKVKQGGRIITSDNRKLFYQPSRVFGVNHINIYGLSRYADEKIDGLEILASFGNRVIKSFGEFGMNPDDIHSLSSPIAIYSDVLDSLNFPRACDLPDNAFPMIKHCTEYMTREWRQTYKLGHWKAEEISDYDITAGYPSLVAKLPDIRGATFFKSKQLPKEYSWGEMYGRLRIEKPVSPFFYQPRNCYPIGEWDDSVTTDQLWLLRRWGIGSFDMDYGYFFTLPKHYAYPFKVTMERLYELRNSGDGLVSKIAKGISVGVWGKFAEIHEGNKLGLYFNSIYARMTTSRCSVKVADFIYRNNMENDVVSILVDGCLATKRVDVGSNHRMGEWRINESLPALVLSTLYQWQGDKKPANITYEQIMEMIRGNLDKPNYGAVDFNLLDYNRHFDSLPRTGRELLENRYQSTPIEILSS